MSLIKNRQFKERYSRFLRKMIVFNLMILILFKFLPPNIGAIRFIILVLGFMPIVLLNEYRENVVKLMNVFIIYMIFSGYISYSNFGTIDPILGKVLIASLGWSIGWFIVRRKADLRSFLMLFFWGAVLTILILILSNIFNFGENSVYSEGLAVKFGGSGVNITKSSAMYVIIFLPLIYIKKLPFKFLKNKFLIYTIIAISLIFILLAVKRGAILGLFSGIVVFGAISKRKALFLKVVIVSLILILPFYLAFNDTISEILSPRINQTQGVFEGDSQDARMIELEMTYEDMLNSSSIVALFGHGAFSEKIYYNILRMHHTDYVSLMHGGGLIGLSLYLLVYLAIFRKIKRLYRRSLKSQVEEALYASGVALLVFDMIIGVSGFYHGIDLRLMSLIYLGGVAKYLFLSSQLFSDGKLQLKIR